MDEDKLKRIDLFSKNPDLALFDNLELLNEKVKKSIETQEETNFLLKKILDKKTPDFPTIPEFPNIPEVDFKETNDLLKKMIDLYSKDNQCEIKLQLE